MTKRSSLVDQVVDQILELIQSDQLEVGKKLLSERELMQICGAGRSTVREALRLLQAQGYVELRPNAGAYLSSKQPDQSAGAELDCRAQQRNAGCIGSPAGAGRGWPRAWPPSAPPIRKSICWWASKP